MNEHILRGRGRPLRADVYRRLDAQIAELRELMGGPPNPAVAAGMAERPQPDVDAMAPGA